MWMWWATLTTRSRIDSATTGLGNNEYQSTGTGIGSFGWIFPAGWGNASLSMIHAFQGEMSHC